MTHINSEAVFDDKMKSITPLLEDYANYDLVIGIPFNNESSRLATTLKSIDEVLQSWIGRRQLIVCAGDCSGEQILGEIQGLTLKHPHIEFLMPLEASGRGMSIRAFLEISKKLEADLLIFSTHMGTEEGPGIDISWLESLLTPIQGNYDIVLGSLRRYFGIDSIAYQFAVPVLESFYGSRVGDPLGGIYAISHDFIEELAGEAKFWTGTINGFGIDFWLITRALAWNKELCEVNLGGIVEPQNLDRRNLIFREMALAIFESVRRDSAIWLKDRLLIKVADVLTRSDVEKPDIIKYSLSDLLNSFKKTTTEFQPIIQQCLSLDMINEINRISELEPEQFSLNDELWVSAIFSLLRNYVFGEEGQQHECLRALTAFYNGRVASYSVQMSAFSEMIKNFPADEHNDLMVRKMESIRQHLTEEFWRQKPQFNQMWLNKSEQVKPPLIPLGYMEYVPGKPVVVPKKMVGKDKRVVQADNVFKNLRKQYEDEFNQFIVGGLGLSEDADSDTITAAVGEFMLEAERALDRLLPGNLYTTEGLEKFVASLFEFVPHQCMFTIGSDLLREMLMRFPPINLMIPMGYYRPAELIEKMDVRNAVTYANLVESWSYSDRDLSWLVDEIKPASFELVDIKPLVISNNLPYGSVSHTKISNLNRITARITIKPLENGKGGRYPKLTYFTSIVRRLGVAEQFSQMFYQNVCERKNIGIKIRNSLLGLRKGDEFSANVIFENANHRALVKNIRNVANKLSAEGQVDMARIFKLMADGYGLSQVLENETFLTCTAWSWASYSYKGGLKIPTPLTTSVEGRWFNHDFLEALYKEMGYDQAEIMQNTFRLIQAGKGGQNLLDTLLPARPKDVTVVVQETTNEPSKSLRRYEGNPLLEPIAGNEWECKYVLNPGALRIKDKVYLFYRAVGTDDVSYIGLAITDGFQVLERLSQPIFSPAIPEEKMGCEDPRLIIIGERIWMLYTAYDGNLAQIAAASIKVEDFLNRRYEQWQREGLAFKNIWDKDAVLFPEKIKGKYILYHRIEPSMWITYMNEVAFPCREQHAIILGPRPGRMWDSLKIGAGAQPLKTRYGWLLVYHGVDHNYVYRLGAILVDLFDPQKVLYRSPNPILEPEEDYEIGLSGAWVPNVVFTCGAVAGSDKEVLDDNDEILVYYGAADTSIGMARATLADLIPEKFRKLP
ncbi:MAG: glycosidase [Firmicutes bacterium HGW-Firmicutes-15]|nr:MAG: glycosidase [Firmicutes bacterium HGW-Firmicutes-15]